MAQYTWYIDDSRQGVVDTYDEAVDVMERHDLQPTGQRSCDGSKEYFSEDGELEEDDDGAYTPSITELD
jgi:hypothetical protein